MERRKAPWRRQKSCCLHKIFVCAALYLLPTFFSNNGMVAALTDHRPEEQSQDADRRTILRRRIALARRQQEETTEPIKRKSDSEKAFVVKENQGDKLRNLMLSKKRRRTKSGNSFLPSALDNIFQEKKKSPKSIVSNKGKGKRSKGQDNGEGGEGDAVRTSRVVVRFRNEQGRRDILKVAKKVHHDFSADGFVAVDVDEDGAKALELDDNIESYEEDNVWQEQGTLDRIVDRRRLDESIPYGIKMVQADQLDSGGYVARVCVVDTGLAIDHPDIDVERVDGADRYSNRDGSRLVWDEDTRGHGTHVAGTMAAAIGNDEGIRGMGNIDVFVTRGLDEFGMAYETDVYQAIEQCYYANAKIITLSLSGPRMTSSMEGLISRLYSQGILIFAAAGNNGQWKDTYPAAHPDVVSVAAVKETGTYWPWSNYGPSLELSAPGHEVLSTSVDSKGNYVYAEYSGTSMAAPHAAGSAALVWSHFPTCSNVQIRYALAYTALDVGTPGCDDDYGYGIVQAKAAYDFLKEHSCDDAKWGQTTSPDGRCSTIDVEPDD